jgi:hypothetical protein
LVDWLADLSVDYLVVRKVVQLVALKGLWRADRLVDQMAD